MPLENLTGSNVFITNLVPSNPAGTDPVSEGDDHIKGTKNVLINSFPAINAAVTATPAQLNQLAPVGGAAFTGVPVAPTAAPGTNTTQIATTAFAKALVDLAVGDLFPPADQSVAGNGYITMPGGLIIQWGKHTGSVPSNGNSGPISFPIPFPTGFFLAVTGENSTNITGGGASWTYQNTLSTITFYNPASSARSGVTYIAVGN